MEFKNNDLISSMYNSYGPIVGKVCEKTSNFMENNLLDNNVQEQITLSYDGPKINFVPTNNVLPESLAIQSTKSVPVLSSNTPVNQVSIPNVESGHVPTVKFSNVNQVHEISNRVTENQVTSTKSKSSSHNNSNTNSDGSRFKNENTNIFLPAVKEKLVGGNEEKMDGNVPIEHEEKNIIEKSTTFFSQKYSIFGYELSLWMIILILVLVICIIYFIYKIFFSKDKLISYQKNNQIVGQLSNKNTQSKSKSNLLDSQSGSGSDSWSDSVSVSESGSSSGSDSESISESGSKGSKGSKKSKDSKRSKESKESKESKKSKTSKK